MKMLPKTALAVMVLVLMAATAATAATAFAGERRRLQERTSVQVAEMINQGSLSMLRIKIRAMQAARGSRVVRVAFAVPK